MESWPLPVEPHAHSRHLDTPQLGAYGFETLWPLKQGRSQPPPLGREIEIHVSRVWESISACRCSDSVEHGLMSRDVFLGFLYARRSPDSVKLNDPPGRRASFLLRVGRVFLGRDVLLCQIHQLHPREAGRLVAFGDSPFLRTPLRTQSFSERAGLESIVGEHEVETKVSPMGIFVTGNLYRHGPKILRKDKRTRTTRYPAVESRSAQARWSRSSEVCGLDPVLSSCRSSPRPLPSPKTSESGCGGDMLPMRRGIWGMKAGRRSALRVCQRPPRGGRGLKRGTGEITRSEGVSPSARGARSCRSMLSFSPSVALRARGAD